MHTTIPARRLQQSLFLALFAILLIGCSDSSSTGGGGGNGGTGGEGASGGAPSFKSCTLEEDGAGPNGALELEVEVVAQGLEVPWGLSLIHI